MPAKKTAKKLTKKTKPSKLARINDDAVLAFIAKAPKRIGEVMAKFKLSRVRAKLALARLRAGKKIRVVGVKRTAKWVKR